MKITPSIYSGQFRLSILMPMMDPFVLSQRILGATEPVAKVADVARVVHVFGLHVFKHVRLSRCVAAHCTRGNDDLSKIL